MSICAIDARMGLGDVFSFLSFLFFKQKTAYEMRISDWSSDVCSSDLVPFVLVTALTACGQSEAPQKAADSKANIPTVEALAANPERLKELRQQCKTDRAKLGDVLCNRVAEATRKRFYGDGETPYTPPKESPKF